MSSLETKTKERNGGCTTSYATPEGFSCGQLKGENRITMKALTLFFLSIAAFAQPAPATKGAAAPTKKAATPTPPAPVRDPGLYATLNTTKGKIVFKLYEKEAPGA